MNPYLNDLTKPGKKFGDRREQMTYEEEIIQDEPINGFSPGYKPHKDATVRTVKPGSRGTEETPPPSRGEQVKAMGAANNTSSPKLKLKMKHGKPSVANAHDDSFLADSSSCNEERSGRATPSGEKSMGGSGLGGWDETRRPSTSPTTTKAIMATTTLGQGPLDNRQANISEKRTTELLGAASYSSNATTATTPTNKRTTTTTDEDDTEHSDYDDDTDGWVIATASTSIPVKGRDHGNGHVNRVSPSAERSARSKRVWLEPTSSEENLKEAAGDLSLPLEGARTSQKSSEKASPTSPADPIPTPSTTTSDVFHSATSLPVVHIESQDSDAMPSIIEHRAALEDHPTDADRQRAFDIFTGDQTSIQKSQAATVLGDVTLTSTRTRKAFMDLFDWTGFHILAAMRDLCGKIILKAETQQVDRILMSLSERWCECNPHHGFKATGKNPGIDNDTVY